jgi:hypothetical protein
MADGPGIIENVVYDSAVRDLIVQEMTWWSKGDHVLSPLVQKFGLVFIEFSDNDSLAEYVSRFPSHYAIKIKS